MTKKIAVLVNEDTMQRCSCGGSTCTRGKNENYESIAEQCAEAGFDVVGYTHGAAVSKDGKEAVVLSAKPVVGNE